jgi:hypothetical protein
MDISTLDTHRRTSNPQILPDRTTATHTANMSNLNMAQVRFLERCLLPLRRSSMDIGRRQARMRSIAHASALTVGRQTTGPRTVLSRGAPFLRKS